MTAVPSAEWEGRGWREITTEHFVLSTDLEGRHALRVLQSLEESRAAMLAAAWNGAKGPPGRTPRSRASKSFYPSTPGIRLGLARQNIRAGHAFDALPDTRMALRLLGPHPAVVRAHLMIAKE